MGRTQKTIEPKKKKVKKKEEETSAPGAVSTEKKKKLKELDEFMEKVLQEAGEDFLEEFKQVEGE
jgi:hypothetical protein